MLTVGELNLIALWTMYAAILESKGTDDNGGHEEPVFCGSDESGSEDNFDLEVHKDPPLMSISSTIKEVFAATCSCVLFLLPLLTSALS